MSFDTNTSSGIERCLLVSSKVYRLTHVFILLLFGLNFNFRLIFNFLSNFIFEFHRMFLLFFYVLHFQQSVKIKFEKIPQWIPNKVSICHLANATKHSQQHYGTRQGRHASMLMGKCTYFRIPTMSVLVDVLIMYVKCTNLIHKYNRKCLRNTCPSTLMSAHLYY